LGRIEGKTGRAADTLLSRRIIVVVLAATLAGLRGIAPEERQLAGLALSVLHKALRLGADALLQILAIGLIDCAGNALESHSVPSFRFPTVDAFIIGGLIGPIRGTDAGRVLKVIHESLWTGHAGQFFAVPYSGIRA
jgi:hypothetical protein